MGEPDVSAYDAVVPYMSVSAEYCGTGVDHDVVADLGVSVHALDRVAVRSEREASGSETGCGDAFTAAMADSLMRGTDLLVACHAGTRAGALKAQEEPF